jgi:hypothetical protein
MDLIMRDGLKKDTTACMELIWNSPLQSWQTSTETKRLYKKIENTGREIE